MRAAWSLVSAMALVLAACKPPAQATPEKRDAPARTGSVSISGDDELARILSWSLPAVALQAGMTPARIELLDDVQMGACIAYSGLDQFEVEDILG